MFMIPEPNLWSFGSGFFISGETIHRIIERYSHAMIPVHYFQILQFQLKSFEHYLTVALETLDAFLHVCRSQHTPIQNTIKKVQIIVSLKFIFNEKI